MLNSTWISPGLKYFLTWISRRIPSEAHRRPLSRLRQLSAVYESKQNERASTKGVVKLILHFTQSARVSPSFAINKHVDGASGIGQLILSSSKTIVPVYRQTLLYNYPLHIYVDCGGC